MGFVAWNVKPFCQSSTKERRDANENEVRLVRQLRKLHISLNCLKRDVNAWLG